MRSKILFSLLLLGSLSFADTPPMPQTARQALLEMFFSKTPGTFDKHLPDALRTALKNAPPGSAGSMVNLFTALSSQAQTQGTNFQTFDTGSILLTAENEAQHTKFEVIVNRDDLRADVDEIEVSFNSYKDGQPQLAGMSPRFTFAMKQETEVWRLHDITFTFKIGLTNPELLKAVNTPLKPTIKTSTSPEMQPATFSMQGGNENTAMAGIRTIVTAEAAYASSYPATGYTCSLSNMGGMGGTERSERQAMLIDPRLQSGKKGGYVFKLASCGGTPANRFRVTAVPAETTAGLRTFCSDESGMLRSGTDANSCFTNGTPVD